MRSSAVIAQVLVTFTGEQKGLGEDKREGAAEDKFIIKGLVASNEGLGMD